MRVIASIVVLALAACASGPDPLSLDEATFDREVEQRFQYRPPQPAPTEMEDQRAGQIADAAYFAQFPNYDRAYSEAARAEALSLAARLQAEAGDLSHEQFVLRAAEIAALADNGHTAIGENAFRKNTPRIPVRTYQFADGLHILWAAPVLADLLGARVDAIEGRSIADIQRVIRRYQGGTDAHRQRRLVAMLESPALLQAAGLARTRDALTLSGVLASGEPFERTIAAEERDRSAWVSSAPRLLFPAPPDFRMRSFLSDADDLPVYLRRRSNLFALDQLPQRGVYIGLSHNADADEGPIADFLDSALARVRSEHPAFVVLDMRLNGGGDYTTTYAFARALPEAAAGASIYVMTSSWTFSAAITTVAALKHEGGRQVVIVGEQVGDRLDFWAEGGAFELPNAFLLAHYTSGRHVYDRPCRNADQCFWLNYRYPVRVSSLAPDIAAPLTFAAYRERRDPAMEAVLEREARRGSNARTR
jgi:hypothetical protein